MKSFANHTFLTKSISIVLVVTGVLGLVTVGMMYIPYIPELLEFGQAMNWFDLLFSSSLAILGVISGIALWRKKRWAFIAASAYFAIQLIVFELPNFVWAPSSGINLTQSYALGYDGLGNFGCGLNFFALGMLILLFLAYKQTSTVSQAASNEEPDSDAVGRVA